MELHVHDREKTTGVSMRPVCNECGYVFDYFAYNTESGLLEPRCCPKCMRAIESFTIESVCPPDTDGIYFAMPEKRKQK